MNDCSVEGCSRPAHAKGMCGMHRRRITRGGSATPSEPAKTRMLGISNGQSKLDEAAVLDIREHGSTVKMRKAMAYKYDVSYRTIDKVVNGETWKWVE